MKFINKLLKKNHYPKSNFAKEFAFTSGGVKIIAFTSGGISNKYSYIVLKIK